ncbi:hypothetical protein FRC19_010199 [Serendipita sp. 401]|nr:hypothetical protein FRC19_010199 [Serendipita sp. 401]KAG9052721.1 hypothetical protein FS842_009347 [Serendipita sp. 407]
MVDEEAIREALLGAQERLIVAYTAGPAALDDFLAEFERLKSNIIGAAKSELLSRETLQIAADVVRGIPIITQSFLRLEQEAAKGLGAVIRNTREQAINCAETASSQDTFQTHGDNVDGDEADESDSENGLSGDYSSGEEYSEDDEESEWEYEEELEDADRPKWSILRDWLLDNIAYPFAGDESKHHDILERANVSYPTFVHWLAQMRKFIRWDRLVQQHGEGCVEKLTALIHAVLSTTQSSLDQHSSIPPEAYQDLSRVKDIVVRKFNAHFSAWWTEAEELFDQLQEFYWLGAEDIVHWSSDEVPESDSEDDEDTSGAENDTFTPSQTLVGSLDFHPHNHFQPSAQPLRSKRKAEGFLEEDHAPIAWPLVPQRNHKRRRLETFDPLDGDSYTSKWIKSLEPVSDNFPSRDSSSQSSPLSPGLKTPVGTNLLGHGNIFSWESTIKSLQDETNREALVEEPPPSASRDDTSQTATPEVQVTTDTHHLLQAPIRSTSTPFDRKRKRKPELTEEGTITQFDKPNSRYLTDSSADLSLSLLPSSFSPSRSTAAYRRPRHFIRPNTHRSPNGTQNINNIYSSSSEQSTSVTISSLITAPSSSSSRSSSSIPTPSFLDTRVDDQPPHKKARRVQPETSTPLSLPRVLSESPSVNSSSSIMWSRIPSSMLNRERPPAIMATSPLESTLLNGDEHVRKPEGWSSVCAYGSDNIDAATPSLAAPSPLDGIHTSEATPSYYSDLATPLSHAEQDVSISNFSSLCASAVSLKGYDSSGHALYGEADRNRFSVTSCGNAEVDWTNFDETLRRILEGTNT